MIIGCNIPSAAGSEWIPRPPFIAWASQEIRNRCKIVTFIIMGGKSHQCGLLLETTWMTVTTIPWTKLHNFILSKAALFFYLDNRYNDVVVRAVISTDSLLTFRYNPSVWKLKSLQISLLNGTSSYDGDVLLLEEKCRFKGWILSWDEVARVDFGVCENLLTLRCIGLKRSAHSSLIGSVHHTARSHRLHIRISGVAAVLAVNGRGNGLLARKPVCDSYRTSSFEQRAIKHTCPRERYYMGTTRVLHVPHIPGCPSPGFSCLYSSIAVGQHCLGATWWRDDIPMAFVVVSGSDNGW